MALADEQTTVTDAPVQSAHSIPAPMSEATTATGTIEIRFAQAVVRLQGHVDAAVLGAVLSSLNR